ncbi:hypothetical protein [Foliimonas ilicis]|uniref:hypothetical protein n=1 Tax=Mesorhizobium sp. SB112 TaxID=3151853 RepID=UPI0032657A3A
MSQPNPLFVNGVEGLSKIKFATCVAVLADKTNLPGKMRSNLQGAHPCKNRLDPSIEAVSYRLELATASVLANQEAKARCSDSAGLAGHRAAKLLALKGSIDVHFAVSAKEAGKEFHDTSPCVELHGVPSRYGVGQLV